MDREAIVFKALGPLDRTLGLAVRGLRATGQLPRVTDGFYKGMGVPLRAMFSRMNDLRVEGLENVPESGGFLLASNHQSWSDVQVLGASCPRRLRFLAKSEFEHWPILRHMIVLSDSPFIRRGGDREGMDMAVGFLREGKALCIFPEGTIPGEENVGRHEVESDTGLLRGRTGAVRLALAARVPIVPVGLSGTGASLPPEVYPRLELLEAPKGVPITVRFGKPIDLSECHDRELDRDELREITHGLMRAISGLVEHERNYIPVQVPIPSLPRYPELGVLVLHGFTSSLKTVADLAPRLAEAGLPFRMPVLRGHGTVYTDLIGVTAQDWYEDAEAALLDLSREVGRVLVVGLSMGGLLAIDLGIRHPEKVAGVVTLAAALRFKDPLAPLAPQVARVVRTWPSPNSFNDPELKASCENYPRFPSDAFLSLLSYAREVEARLAELRQPICVLQSKKDQIVAPLAANLIYKGVSSPWREIHWFLRSGHEMGQDMEKEGVFDEVMRFARRFVAPQEPRSEPPVPATAAAETARPARRTKRESPSPRAPRKARNRSGSNP